MKNNNRIERNEDLTQSRDHITTPFQQRIRPKKGKKREKEAMKMGGPYLRGVKGGGTERGGCKLSAHQQRERERKRN